MLITEKYKLCVNVDFKNNIFRFAFKQKGGLISIMIDHNSTFKQGMGFEFYVEDQPATLTLVNPQEAKLVIKQPQGFLPYEQIIILSPKEGWFRFVETDDEGRQYDVYKNKSVWQS